jgi:CHAD domain-containing protein
MKRAAPEPLRRKPIQLAGAAAMRGTPATANGRTAHKASVGEALAALAENILDEGRRALQRDDLEDSVVVHDFRKAMKRWRAFLRLIEPAVGSEARDLRIEARDIARRMADARDLQAALDALADIKRHAPPEAASFAGARKRLEEQREAAEGATLTPELRERSSEVLGHAGEIARTWAWDRFHFAQVADGLTIAYRRARSLIPDDWSGASGEELHTLRQRVVVHRYQMQLVEPLWPRFGKLWVGEAQRLRERLGSRQDLEVLRGLTAPRALLAPWRSRLLPLIEAREQVHVAAARKLAGRLFAERPRAFRQRIEALWESRELGGTMADASNGSG